MDSAASGAAAAGTWQLGDLTVSRLGLGAMRLTGRLPSGESVPGDRSRSLEVLRRAVQLGVNHIDTAAFYFSPLRSANQLISAALAPYPEDLVIVTKVGPGRDPWGQWYSARPDQLRGQVEENLRQLGRDHLDVVNLRRMRQESIAEHFGALAELRDAGLIRHLGISEVSVGHLQEALAIAPVVCVQNRYGLGLREHEPVLRACAARSIAFVPFFSLVGDARQAGPGGSGGPGGPGGTQTAAVLDVARRHQATPAQVRLAWTLHQAPNVLAIPGTGDPAHLAENVAAAALRLTPGDLSLLDGGRLFDTDLPGRPRSVDVMRLLSVNVGKPRPDPNHENALTGIDKHPVSGPVMVTAPGPKGTGQVGLAGDRVFALKHHGGPDQAVYAYAREDLDGWETELGTLLRNGMFGENLTTAGVDVNGALIGERWRVGQDLILEVCVPRIPCRTFQGWLAQRGWVRRFTAAAKPGAYLRVIEPGAIRAGDPVAIEYRPEHDVTIAVTFRALTSEPDLLPRLLAAAALPDEAKELARKRTAPQQAGQQAGH